MMVVVLFEPASYVFFDTATLLMYKVSRARAYFSTRVSPLYSTDSLWRFARKLPYSQKILPCRKIKVAETLR